jgi:hypothetical protein
LAPVGLVILFFKLRYAPPNDLVSGQGPDTLTRLTDWSRHELILRSVARHLWEFGSYPMVALVVYALLVGRPPTAERKPGLLGLGVLLGLMAAGYYLVYLTTPHPLEWHVNSSARRLIAQVWPTALLACFLAVATLSEARGKVLTPSV